MDRQEPTSEERAAAREREYLVEAHRIIQQHIGADAQYRPCGWCGHLVALASQGGRALYHYDQEYLHPGCVDAVRFAEAQ